MIREAIDKILSLAGVQTQKIGDQVFTSSDLRRVSEATTETMKVRNLKGIVDYIISNFDDKFPVIVHVQSPTHVSVVTGYNRDLQRNVLDWISSGITVMRAFPLSVGSSTLVFLVPLRSRKPFCTSFSMVAALVAGVPMP